ncbi:septum formation inhibitor Maf [Aquimarina brevivitae]|uniref:Septum formation inhibitor Maf n=1 Tax=Aquimarina brevivitae TaxID=323412 RepID=A0A4Q7NWE3_9FLAO|nr:septum formation inhibitor Maf [Aquimarina brevivitae]RZS90722.1 hypothetical protein EV197_3252 [Aquimarina brevivitae]
MKQITSVVLTIFLINSIIGCNPSNTTSNTNTDSQEVSVVEKTKESPSQAKTYQPTSAFKKYWYSGAAEITSYDLRQARYGEIREGKAVLIFVTEDFLPKVQVKANQRSGNTIPVLKLNATKNFNTGIYPYSIMQSTFYPIQNNQHAIKVSSSIQEWCGQVYAQLNTRDQFEVTSHSYFEGEADQKFSLDTNVLENELWTKIRIAPNSLPEGTLQVIPSLAYTRLKHKQIKAYEATATITRKDSVSIYTLDYPELKRTLAISYSTQFPHTIEGWTETIISGFGNNATTLTSTATKLKRIKSPYWTKNSNKDEYLRNELELQ